MNVRQKLYSLYGIAVIAERLSIWRQDHAGALKSNISVRYMWQECAREQNEYGGKYAKNKIIYIE